MNMEKYLPMSSEELYEHLISDVMANPSEGERLTERLSKTDRYQRDFAFRILTDTSKATCFFLLRKYSEAIALCKNLVSRAAMLSMWKVLSNNLNLMGSAYLALRVLESALECFQAVIKNESDHGFFSVSSAAYNNIALIYFGLEAHEKASRYFDLALETLEKEGRMQPRYETKLLSYLSYLAINRCLSERVDEASALILRTESVSKASVSPQALFLSYIAKMYHAFYTGDYEKGRYIFNKTKSEIPKIDALKQVDLLLGYIKLCVRFNLPLSFYEEDLLSAESLEASGLTITNVEIYEELCKYYENTGKEEPLKRTTKKYIRLLKRDANDLRIRQLASLQVVEDLIKDSEKLSDISSKNTELRMIAAEALQTKNALEETYNRIEVINDLGKKITSSLNLSEVVDTIYKNLGEKVPMSSFVLMVAEPEKRQLRSIVYYRDGVLQPELYLDIDHPDSVFAKCYHTKEIIVSGDIQNDPRFKHRRLLKVGKGTRSESVVFMPLNADGQIIGICSIQARGKNSYTKKHLVFLEELLPYLSISLNNAVRSRRLEKEIQSHLQTQRELEEANRRLNELSSLDGLTQISNRRDFDKRISALLKEAQETKTDITVFMLDIDNFKLYNDTYGHLEGDEVLKRAAMIVRLHMDKVGGLSARFGGEEFIAACIGLDREKSFELAERIRRDIFGLSIENRYTFFGRMSISIGAATTDRPEEITKSVLMRYADLALYRAKNTGKNKVIVKEIPIRENI